jgi:hypothetical protein
VVDLRTRFAAVQLASLDERPIAQAERLLLIAAARVANTGLRWVDEQARTSVEPRDGGSLGHAPTRIEPVQATLTLRGLRNARSVALQPLDGQGQPSSSPHAARAAGDGYLLELTGDPATTWYLVTVVR